MKKLLVVLAISMLCLAACPTDDNDGDDGDGKGGKGDTTLTIINSSDLANLYFWFGDVEFSDLDRGAEDTQKVSAGTKYVTVALEYFFQNKAVTDLGYISVSQHFEINEVVTCEEGEKNQFTFTNSTIVTMDGGDSGFKNSGGLTTGTLKNILNSIEQYYLTQG